MGNHEFVLKGRAGFLSVSPWWGLMIIVLAILAVLAPGSTAPGQRP